MTPTSALHASPQTVQQGTLTWPDFDYQNDGPLELSGEWEVIWSKLVPPEQFDAEYVGDYFALPARWNVVEHPAMDRPFGILFLGIGYSFALLLRLQITFQAARITSQAL